MKKNTKKIFFSLIIIIPYLILLISIPSCLLLVSCKHTVPIEGTWYLRSYYISDENKKFVGEIVDGDYIYGDDLVLTFSNDGTVTRTDRFQNITNGSWEGKTNKNPAKINVSFDDGTKYYGEGNHYYIGDYSDLYLENDNIHYDFSKENNYSIEEHYTLPILSKYPWLTNLTENNFEYGFLRITDGLVRYNEYKYINKMSTEIIESYFSINFLDPIKDKSLIDETTVGEMAIKFNGELHSIQFYGSTSNDSHGYSNNWYVIINDEAYEFQNDPLSLFSDINKYQLPYLNNSLLTDLIGVKVEISEPCVYNQESYEFQPQETKYVSYEETKDGIEEYIDKLYSLYCFPVEDFSFIEDNKVRIIKLTTIETYANHTYINWFALAEDGTVYYIVNGKFCQVIASNFDSLSEEEINTLFLMGIESSNE